MAVVVRDGCPAHLLEGYAEMPDEVSLTSRRLTRSEVESRRALGERAAVEGVARHRVTAGYVAAAQMRSVAGAVMGALAQAVEAVGQGYAHAQRLAVRKEEAARREFVDPAIRARRRGAAGRPRGAVRAAAGPRARGGRRCGPRTRWTTPIRSPGGWTRRWWAGSVTGAS